MVELLVTVNYIIILNVTYKSFVAIVSSVKIELKCSCKVPDAALKQTNVHCSWLSIDAQFRQTERNDRQGTALLLSFCKRCSKIFYDIGCY